MEIDLFSIVIGLLALSTFFVPIFYFEVKKKRGHRKFVRHFLDTATQRGVSPQTYDTWNNSYAIGLDESQGKLIYLKRKNGDQRVVLLELASITGVKTAREENRVTSQSGSPSVISRLLLALTIGGIGKAEERLEFYHGERGGPMQAEADLAGRWAENLRRQLNLR